MVHYIVTPHTTPIQGTLSVSADKSISHRALILSAIAKGTTEIHNLSDASDVKSTLDALLSMGVSIERSDSNSFLVQGRGLHGLHTPAQALDLGNSGTAMRLLVGVLANQSFPVILTGDDSLCSRPMQRIAQPLNAAGAQIILTVNNTAPIQCYPVPELQPFNYRLPVASAQVKSCLLLAALYSKGQSRLVEKTPTRDHTERLMMHFKIPIQQKENEIVIMGGEFNAASPLSIPGDISSAAFLIAAALLIPGSDLEITGCGINYYRMGFVRVLQAMGADIEVHPLPVEQANEPIGNIRVRYSPLQGIHVPEAEVVSMIDEFPIFFVLAALAKGTTEIQGVQELRYKESDRLSGMLNALNTLGVKYEMIPDGVIIQGGSLCGGKVESQNDHRMAMALTIAGLVAQEPLFIAQCDNVATSFPTFTKIMRHVGVNVREVSL